MRWLFRWQHVAAGSQVRDERGALEVLRQLQGFEVPASAWERQILARRISNFDSQFLDQLCLTGAVGWGRLSPHPAMLDDSSGGTRRVVPTSVAPITFFVRDEADWMALPNIRAAHHDIEAQAGSKAICAYLGSIYETRFIQSLKSHVLSPLFTRPASLAAATNSKICCRCFFGMRSPMQTASSPNPTAAWFRAAGRVCRRSAGRGASNPALQRGLSPGWHP